MAKKTQARLMKILAENSWPMFMKSAKQHVKSETYGYLCDTFEKLNGVSQNTER